MSFRTIKRVLFDIFFNLELLFDEEYGAEADIYSFGMVLLEVNS